MLDLLKRHRVLLNAVLGQVLWFVCVLGGARREDLFVVAVVFVVVGGQLLIPSDCRWRLVVRVAVVGAYGIVLDSLLTVLGVFDPVRVGIPYPWCPLWLGALWVAFGSMTVICLHRLHRHPWLSALAGAVGGPSAYFCGVRFGALEFHHGYIAPLAVLALVWAFTAWFALWLLPLWLDRFEADDLWERGLLRKRDQTNVQPSEKGGLL